MSASIIGVISVWKKVGGLIENNLHFLVSFSAGVFLIVAYNLFIETIEHSLSLSWGILWILAGMFAFWLLFKLIPSFHHHHDKECTEHESGIDYKKVVFGDALHNIGDGILLASSFIAGPVLGMAAAISIFVHELIQEVSEFFILKEAGLSTKKALKINFFASSTILIGSVGGFLLLENFKLLEIPVLGMASGIFIIVVLQDLIPHSIKNASKAHLFKHIVWFILGLILMSGTNFVLSEGHSHGHEDHDQEENHLHENEHQHADDHHEEDHNEEEHLHEDEENHDH